MTVDGFEIAAKMSQVLVAEICRHRFRRMTVLYELFRLEQLHQLHEGMRRQVEA